MDYKIITNNQTRYIIIPKLIQLGLSHCFTTVDMDMGIRTNPSTKDVQNNLILLNKTLGIAPKVLFSGVQTHSKNITSVLDIDQGEDNELGRVFQETDGLITDLKGTQLLTTYADCTPIILFDPIKKVHSNVHSGWKGTLQKIGKEAVSQMVRDYQCDPKNIIAIIGPSIGKDDFEVEEDVASHFKAIFQDDYTVIRKKDTIKY